MNYKVVLNLLGRTFIILAILMAIPLAVGIYYQENNFLSFLIPILFLLAVGIPLTCIKTKDKSLYAKEGFVIVAISWVVLSLIGCLPFVISGEIPNFFDAFFETVSGFTTTGASILVLPIDKIGLSRAMMFWRCFTHWIGGMGVLVFVLAVLPSEGNAMHILRAEAPGPSASKFVSKIGRTAKILYGIYAVLTLILFIMLVCGGMSAYESLLNSFSTAGTGGFAIYGDSIAHYNSVYVEVVIGTFMFLFGINFNLFYLIILGHFAKAIKSEEFLTYFCIVFIATLTVAINLTSIGYDFWQGLRYGFFQTTSISSTTGFSSTDFSGWPELSKSILLFLTIVGACGGSTCGGIKVSRAIILFKSSRNGLLKALHPRAVAKFKLEGEVVTEEVERNTYFYFVLWILIVICSTMILCFDTGSGANIMDNFSATLACIGNVGPGITKLVGPAGSFVGYSWFSKTVLSVVMLAGRLEIIPLIILFSPRTWMKGQ